MKKSHSSMQNIKQLNKLNERTYFPFNLNENIDITQI